MGEKQNHRKGHTVDSTGTIIYTRPKQVDTRMDVRTAQVNLTCYSCNVDILVGDSIVIWESTGWMGPVHENCGLSLMKRKVENARRASRRRRAGKEGKQWQRN